MPSVSQSQVFVDRVTRHVSFEELEPRLRGTVVVRLLAPRAQPDAEAAAEAVCSMIFARLRQYPRAIAAMGKEAEVARGVIAELPRSAGVSRVELSLRVGASPVPAGAPAGRAEARDSELPPSESNPRARGGRDERGRVLLVDDDLPARLALHGVLSDDFLVTVADGMPSAQALLARHDFDVLLTDLEMPKGSGLSLLKLVESRWPWIIGILLTGHEDRAEVRNARGDGRLYRVMRKPYDPEALIASIRGAVTLSRMRRVGGRLARPKR